MGLFDVVLTVVLTLAVVAAILLFERKRAEQIDRDTRDMARERQRRTTQRDDD